MNATKLFCGQYCSVINKQYLNASSHNLNVYKLDAFRLVCLPSCFFRHACMIIINNILFYISKVPIQNLDMVYACE